MPLTLRRIGLALLLLIALGGAGFGLLAWHPAIDPVAPVDRDFASEQVAEGARLASLGYCASCHTAEDGKPYAGGRPIETPFGAIHATNITPDPDTGIGRWSLPAFDRAMRRGIDRAGRQLYPAFPYTHYTGLSDADIGALYAFFMSREPVAATAPENDLPFPLNLRPLLAGWNLLFFREGRHAPDPARDVAWNRGAYLAEALSHCGACHSPRNALGATVAARAYEGGVSDDWWAPPLNRASPAPIPWTETSLVRYLRDWDPEHGGAAGPMRPVVDAHTNVPETDIAALARYVADLYGPPGAAHVVDRRDVAETDLALARGAATYAGACAVCHESGGWAAGGVPYTVGSLGQRTTLAGSDPRNLIHVILEGIAPRPGAAAGPIMPAYADTLTEDQVVELVAYLRARFSDRGSWPDLRETVRERMRPSADRYSIQAEARP